MRLAAVVASFSLVVAAVCVSAQADCNATLAARDAARVATLRAGMRSTGTEKDDIGYEVPESLQVQLPILKEDLARTVRAVMGCSGPETKAADVEAKLAALLKANAAQPKPGEAVRNGDPRYAEAMSSEWTSNLLVHVSEPKPELLQVELSFNIICGSDTVLMVFEREGSRWHEALRWQAAPYKEVNGAFGDGVFTGVLTPAPGEWRLIAIHGRPWCTSRFSGFDIDVLAPSRDPERARVVWHTERSYSRGDGPERLKVLGADTFEFRVNADAMEFDMGGGFERTAIYRYRLDGEKVTRLEPIATNGRFFVEEWLSMPWEEAAAQASPGALEALRAVHGLHENSNPKDANSYTSWSAGPVRACAEKGRFQVEFDTQQEIIVPGKPGGDHGPAAPHYFFLQQVSDGYRMERVAAKPDPQCGGPDLMQSKK